MNEKSIKKHILFSFIGIAICWGAFNVIPFIPIHLISRSFPVWFNLTIFYTFYGLYYIAQVAAISLFIYVFILPIKGHLLSRNMNSKDLN